MEKTNSRSLKIAVIGPESTGKTTLCNQLAKYYNGVVVPEFAREYLNNLTGNYTLQDVLLIAKEQFELEKKNQQQEFKITFCDTNLITIKIWLKVKYNYFNADIDKLLLSSCYDLHILTNTDLPWVNDPLREHPYLRNELFEMHELILNQFNLNYIIVSGTGESRVNNAIDKINKLIQIY